MANSVDPGQTALIGAVCSGSTLFASILNSSVMLGNYLQQTTSADDIFRYHTFFLGALRVYGIIQTILVAFSMKKSRACTCMLSSKHDDFKFLKNCEKHKKQVHHVHHSYRARATVLSYQTSLSLTRNMNIKVAIELYYIFSKISKFKYW